MVLLGVCLGALLLCCSALPCCASCLVFSLRSCALLWVQKAKKITARGAKEASGRGQKCLESPSKILSKSFQNGSWKPPGEPPEVSGRHLAPKVAPRSAPGSLRGCSWRLLGRSWRLWGRSWGAWHLLGRSGGVPGTLLGVILASLGCFLQGRLKNDPRS